MQDSMKREAQYWRAFALLALVNKRTIRNFRVELARCKAGSPVSDDDLQAILSEFYAELGKILDSPASESSFTEGPDGPAASFRTQR